MRDVYKSPWGWRVTAIVLAGGLLFLGAGTVVTHAGERDDDRHQRNPFQRILDKLDKILDAIKGEGGQDGNHTLRWDQNLPAAQRFVVLAAFNNEAVLDKNTGVVWEKSPRLAATDWQNARSTCLNNPTGGQKGWRLPSISELASLVDPSVALPGPTLPPGHPFVGVQSSGYWSATTVAGSGGAMEVEFVWDENFSSGDVGIFSKAFISGHVWCVRGGMNADAY